MRSLDVIPRWTKREREQRKWISTIAQLYNSPVLHLPGWWWATSAAGPCELAAGTVPCTPPNRQLLVLPHRRSPRWNSKWPGRQSGVPGNGIVTGQWGTSTQWTDNWRSTPQPTRPPNSATRYARSPQRTLSNRGRRSLSWSRRDRGEGEI